MTDGAGARRLYLDHAATSPIRPEAIAAMTRCWQGPSANPASLHAEGRHARAVLAEARARVAALVGARPEEVIFTSGATEASNLAVRGGAFARRAGGHRLAATAVEHAATRRAVEQLAVEGWQVRLLDVEPDGRVRGDGLRFEPGTTIVSVIAGHNELGTLQPLAALAEAAHAAGALLHLDAVQVVAHVDLTDVPWDLLSLSGHKLGGPAGVGALVRRGDVAIAPLIVGGSQEGGLRPGTVPVALAAGFGAACEAALGERAGGHGAIGAATRRDRLGGKLLSAVTALRPAGAWATRPADALPHVASFLLQGVAGDEIVHALDAAGIAAASASACLSGSRTPTLDAIGAESGAGLLRLSLGWTTDDQTIDEAAARIAPALLVLLAMDPFDRRRAPLAAHAALAGLALGPAHWEAAEAVYRFWRAEGVLPGARQLARLLPASPRLEVLYPAGLPTLAAWLALPVPRGGCRAMLG